jgi:hypothetical protein
MPPLPPGEGLEWDAEDFKATHEVLPHQHLVTSPSGRGRAVGEGEGGMRDGYPTATYGDVPPPGRLRGRPPPRRGRGDKLWPTQTPHPDQVCGFSSAQAKAWTSANMTTLKSSCVEALVVENGRSSEFDRTARGLPRLCGDSSG